MRGRRAAVSRGGSTPQREAGPSSGKGKKGASGDDEVELEIEEELPRRVPPLNAREYMAQDEALPAADSPEILALRRLPLVGATRALLFWQIGARTLADIAALDETAFRRDPRVLSYPDGSIRDAFPLIQGYARAITAGEPQILAPEPLFERLEGPFIFFDLEFMAGIGEIFLWGLKRSGDGPMEQWWGHTREKQRESMLKFKQLIIDEDPLFVAYGSTASDEVAIRDAARRFGLEGGWLREMRFLDLLQRVIFTESPETQRVYLPVRNLKCDAVAEFFGYKKPGHIDVRDGYHAYKLYQRYKRRPDPKIADRLMRYNAEDLIQTEMIFEGLRELFRRVD